MAVMGMHAGAAGARDPACAAGAMARRRCGASSPTWAWPLVVALFVIPFLWMIVTSLKSPDDLTGNPLSWIPQSRLRCRTTPTR